MAVDSNQKNMGEHLDEFDDSAEGRKGGKRNSGKHRTFKSRRGNYEPRGEEETGINNVPGVADDEVGMHFGSQSAGLDAGKSEDNGSNQDTGVVSTEAVEFPDDNNTIEKDDASKVAKRTMTKVPFDAIRPADWGILNKAQKEAIEASVDGTSSLRGLDVLEESMQDKIKNDPRFQTMLDKQRIYLLKEKAKKLGASSHEGVDESSEPGYNANEKDDITKQEIELAKQKLVEATNKLAKLESLYAKKNAENAEKVDEAELKEIRSNLGG